MSKLDPSEPVNRPGCLAKGIMLWIELGLLIS